jgi:hypothetical protein
MKTFPRNWALVKLCRGFCNCGTSNLGAGLFINAEGTWRGSLSSPWHKKVAKRRKRAKGVKNSIYFFIDYSLFE